MVKILFIKVNPKGTVNLFLDNEENSLSSARVASDNRDYIDIQSKGAVTKSMLHSELEIFKPNILHISGHGSEDGVLYLHDAEDHKVELPLDMFAEFIKNYTPHLKCVFLNACFSLMSKDEFQDIDDIAVIGMNSEVPNDTALSFSSAFYTSFFGGKTITESFNTAIGVVGIDGFGDESIPVLLGNSAFKIPIIDQPDDGNEVAELSDVVLVPDANFNIAVNRRKKRKRDYYILAVLVAIVSIGLVTSSIVNGQGTLFTVVGIVPLGLIKWIKDKLDGLEDSLSLLTMLKNEINDLLERLQNPPVPNANATADKINEQFWNIVNN